MRKFLLLVAAVAVGFLGGGTSAVAQELVTSVNDLANGDCIVLKSVANTCEGQYLNGASEKSLSFSPDVNVYEVEFKANSTTEIYLKQKSSGQYIGRDGNVVVMAATVADAAAFTIKPNSGLTDDKGNWPELDETEKSQVIRFITGGTTFLNTNGSGQKPKYATGTGSWSIWYVYKYVDTGLNPVGTYLLSRVGAYLNPLATGEVVLSAETKAKSVWKVEEAGAGYTVQNVLTGLYVNVNAGAFTLSETAQELALNIKEDVVEFAGMEWSAVKNDALVAEATTGSTKIQKVSEIAGMLDDYEGVPSVLDFLSVEDWNAYSPYQPFSGRYYRIYAVARDMYIGLDANGSEPLAVAGNEKNLEQVWQLVASGNGFKLCNPNMNAADATKGYLSAPNAYGGVHASMRAENGTLTTLYLDDRELTVAGAKFFISSNATLAYGANGRGENLNVEADGTITRWRGENAQFSAHRVKTWNVALASVGTNTYASVYLPFAVTVGSDVKAYVGDGDVTEGWLKIKEAVEVASGAGFILEGTGASATLTIGASDAAATSSISGTYRSLVVDIDEERASYLVLGTNAGDVGFYRMAGSLSEIPANKAYLEVVGGGAVKLLFPGMMTGVEDAVVAEDADAQIFDLSGRKVLNPVKGGIYVKNGKKVIFK